MTSPLANHLNHALDVAFIGLHHNWESEPLYSVGLIVLEILRPRSAIDNAVLCYLGEVKVVEVGGAVA